MIPELFPIACRRLIIPGIMNYVMNKIQREVRRTVCRSAAGGEAERCNGLLARTVLGSTLPLGGISMLVKHREYYDRIASVEEIHAVGKPAEQYVTQ